MYLNQVFKYFLTKKKKDHTADNIPAGATAEVTTKLPKLLTKTYKPRNENHIPRNILQ